jgi:hypothetical protein
MAWAAVTGADTAPVGQPGRQVVDDGLQLCAVGGQRAGTIAESESEATIL